MKIKQILIIIFIILITFYLGYNFRTGSFKSIIPTQKTTEILQEEHHSPPSVVIEPGSGVEEASYIIFKDDEGLVYAKNGNTGGIEFSGNDDAVILNAYINKLSSTGGKIVIKDRLTISSTDILIPYLYSDLIIQGLGARSYLNQFSQVNQSHSALMFNGRTIINGSNQWNVGKLIFQDLAMTFTNVNNRPLITLDWSIPVFDRVLLYESGNTYSSGGVIGVITESSTSPPSGPNYRALFRDTYIQMNSPNIVGIFAHYEPVIFDNVWLSFNNDNQVGIIISGVKTQVIKYLHVWLSTGADGGSVLTIFNQDKTVNIASIGIGTQAGAGSNTPNVLLSKRGTSYTNDHTNYLIGSIGGDDDVNYGTTPTAPIYLWADSVVKKRTKIYGLFEGRRVSESGTVTIPDGSISITVSHILADTPSMVTVTPNKQTDFWVTGKTSTQFTINIPSSITNGVSFDWYAEV